MTIEPEWAVKSEKSFRGHLIVIKETNIKLQILEIKVFGTNSKSEVRATGLGSPIAKKLKQFTKKNSGTLWQRF